MQELKDLVKRILNKIACAHEWDVYHESRVFDGDYSERPHTIKHTLICKKCGKIKQIKV